MGDNLKPRDREAELLDHSVMAARGQITRAENQVEANFFSLAASTVASTHPGACQALTASASAYFSEHPADELEAGEVIRRGWVISMPRLRDMLTERLGRE